jgi:demethylmacrocin O-methyltransferase
MWRSYFPRGRIYGIDIYDKSCHNERRVRTFLGDQTDASFLLRVIAEIGNPNIVIDDGSHINSHVIQTFQILFPLLANDGIYVVEDTQTAYWPQFGGTSEDLAAAPTSMCMLKRLIDGLNHEEFIRPGYVPSYFDENIVSMHFYHNLAFVYKGRNKEGSNTIKANVWPS